MDKYIKFVLKKPIYVIVATVIVTVIMAMGLPKLKFDNSIDVMMPREDKEYLHYEDVKKIYGNIGKFILVNVTGKDIWKPEFLNNFNDLVTDLEEYKEYNESFETDRIKKYDSIVSKGEMSVHSLIKQFENDHSLRREIIRNISNLSIVDKFKNGRNHAGNNNKKNPYLLSNISDTKLSERNLRKIRKGLLNAIELKKPGEIDKVISPLTVKDMSGKNDTLKSIDLIEKDDNENRIIPKDLKSVAQFKKNLTKNPAFKKALYTVDSQTGKITDFCILIKLENSKDANPLTKKLFSITDSYKHLSTTSTGVPIVNKHMNDYMQGDLKIFLPLVILVILMVFFLNFRTIRGVLLPFGVLVMSDIWIMGLMGHLGFKITIMGTSLPNLMVAIGSSYSIHVINQYYIDLGVIRKTDKFSGLKSSMSHISVTVFLAGFTTFLGFLSLLTNQIEAIREWGILSAIGVLFAVLISTSFIPAFFMLLKHNNGGSNESDEKDEDYGFEESTSHKKTWIDPVINLLINLTINHYKKVIAIIIVVIAVSIAGITKLNVETAFMSYFKEDSIVRQNTLLMGQKYGGSYGLSIIIDTGKQDGIKDPKFLTMLDEIRAWLILPENSDLNVGKTDAISDVIKTMNMAMNNDNPAFYKIPDKKMDVMDYFEIYSGDDDDFDGRFDDFESYIDPPHRSAMLFVKLWEKEGYILNTHHLIRIDKKISTYLKNKLPKGYTFSITGEPKIMIKLSDYIVQGQMMSLLFCLITVFIIIILLFKNWKAGLVSLIPMGVGLIINFGIMGWFGINLDIATAIIASMVIGIGIDDTIHLLNTYRHFRAHDLSFDETIERTLHISGKAIIYTSIALIFGFSVLAFSNFVPVIFFGLLTSITMLATTVGALLILPAVMKATGVNLKESPSQSLFWKIFYIGRFFEIKKDK